MSHTASDKKKRPVSTLSIGARRTVALKPPSDSTYFSICLVLFEFGFGIARVWTMGVLAGQMRLGALAWASLLYVLLFERLLQGAECASVIPEGLRDEHRAASLILSGVLFFVFSQWVRGIVHKEGNDDAPLSAATNAREGLNVEAATPMVPQFLGNLYIHQQASKAVQGLTKKVQDAWWQYIGLPLGFRVTRALGVVKNCIQFSLVVFLESVRMAPKRLYIRYWDKGSFREAGAQTGARDCTQAELSSIKKFGRRGDCLSSVVAQSGPCSNCIRSVVPDEFLLHFGAIFGENSSRQALQQIGRLGKVGNASGLLGPAEDSGWLDKDWSSTIRKSKKGISFSMQKKYLRKGLFVYRTTTVIENADVSDFRAFNLNFDERLEWDWSMAAYRKLRESDRNSKADSCTGVYFLDTRMPGPLANREYCFARRVWNRQDGGCYCVCVSTPHSNAPLQRKKVRVEEFTTAFVIRPTTSREGLRAPAVEISSIYFDNPKMRSMAYNLAMKTSMWAAVQGLEDAFRKYMLKQQVQNNVQGLNEELDGDEHGNRRPPLIRNMGRFAQKAVVTAVLFIVLKGGSRR